MWRVEGENPTAALRRTGHHAQQMLPMVGMIAGALLFESPTGKDKNDHVIRQSRTGAGSYGLYLSDGRQYHLRPGYGNGRIDRVLVYRHYRYQALNEQPMYVLRLDNPSTVRRFARRLKVK